MNFLFVFALVAFQWMALLSVAKEERINQPCSRVEMKKRGRDVLQQQQKY